MGTISIPLRHALLGAIFWDNIIIRNACFPSQISQ